MGWSVEITQSRGNDRKAGERGDTVSAADEGNASKGLRRGKEFPPASRGEGRKGRNTTNPMVGCGMQ